jgi:chloramphenicol O-acetyltransferase
MNIIDNTQIYINLLDVLKCKCKVLFSIMTAIIRHIYKDYIKNSYNHIYQTPHMNCISDKKKKNTNVLIISNL